MTYTFRRAVVIGAGTMGAGIAAHLVNAGFGVTLLDIVPAELTDEELKLGLSLDAPQVRNRVVRTGLERARKSRPASFLSPALSDQVRLGNLEDDFDTIADADWVIEVILEDLHLKQALMGRIDNARRADCIVSTNTSGIPVHSIADGRSESFRQHFLGTHFFNPPRYLKLLEIIPTESTLPEVVSAIREVGERRMGKGIVICKDTPNFIANRIGSVSGAFVLDFVLRNGYTIPEVDAITGPIMGRPRTATFRLLDLVGVDIANHVRRNLAELIPDDKAAQAALSAGEAVNLQESMLKQGWLGNKSGVGFYKLVNVDGKKEFWPLDFETLTHQQANEKPRFESIGKVKDIEDLGARLERLLEEEDRAAELVQAVLLFGLSYASLCIPEIADSPLDIDNAVRWGFMHEAGPFEIWDRLGVEKTVEAIRAAGYEVAPWVDEMLKHGIDSFYRVEQGRRAAVFLPEKGGYEEFIASSHHLSLPSLTKSGGLISRNDGASLIDLGDGIACVEFHTKMNALDQDIGGMVMEALDKAETSYAGLVIGSEAENFSAGANLFMVAMMAQQGMWNELDELIRGLQEMNMRMRYFHRPVVAAVSGLTLGGGAEVMMHANRVVAHCELYAGLVELGAGVIPAGGGTKEMLRRVLNPPMRTENSDPLSFLERIFIQVGQAKVATSAVEAREFGLLGTGDRIVMNRDHLVSEAKREALHMAQTGYQPPPRELIYASGRDMLAALKVGIYMFAQGKYITEHDTVVAGKLAYVMTGGNLSRPTWVDEQTILDLEREAFLSLCGEEKTQQRMWNLLQTGKPLRN